MEDRNEEIEETESNETVETTAIEETDSLSDKIIEKADDENEAVTSVANEAASSVKEAAASAVSISGSGDGSALPKMLLLFAVIIALGAGLVFWKKNVGAHLGDNTTRISKEEMEILLKDFPPQQLKALGDDPEQKKQMIGNLKEILAIASQARKDGFAEKPEIKDELKGMEMSLYAMNYDREINSDKGPMPPFGFITEDQVKEFWGTDEENTGFSWIWKGAESRRREAEFQKFLNGKIELARQRGQIAKDQEPSEQELKQARDSYAKAQIYYEEVKNKLANLNSLDEEEQKKWTEFKEKTELQIKLQKAQFLTQNYAQEVLTKKFEVTDEEVQKYMEDHPELTNSAEKKTKAEEILKKVKDGGDFAELAKEFSDDPGSKNKGGLYEGIAKGQFAPEFEAVAFALKPGDVHDKIVKTNFGYHIIKLEKLGEAKGVNGQTQPTFDARHILISTMVKDPANPMAREMPAEQLAKSKLEEEKQKQILEDIKKNNPVEVAEDFEIPEISEEELKKQQEAQMKQMQQMQQQQRQAPPPPKAEEKK